MSNIIRELFFGKIEPQLEIRPAVEDNKKNLELTAMRNCCAPGLRVRTGNCLSNMSEYRTRHTEHLRRRALSRAFVWVQGLPETL